MHVPEGQVFHTLTIFVCLIGIVEHRSACVILTVLVTPSEYSTIRVRFCTTPQAVLLHTASSGELLPVPVNVC